MEKKKQYRILSIDGGGIRGLIPAMVLAEIEKRTGQPIARLFDMIAGTSTGGILSLALTKPDPASPDFPQYSAEELVMLYQDKGEKIFPKSSWRRFKSFGGLSDERYPQEGIEEVLAEYFGNAELKDALCKVLVTSYDIEIRKPFFFKSEKARKDETRNFLMREAARATSAAPTYFEPFKLKTDDELRYFSLIDGGVFANNPTMCAYAEAVRMGYEDILVLSLGTGEMTKPIMHSDAIDWGVVGWIKPLIDIMMDGNADTVAYQAAQIFEEKEHSDYYRIQARLIEGSQEMDNVSKKNMRMLKILAEELIANESRKIEKICHKLMKDREFI